MFNPAQQTAEEYCMWTDSQPYNQITDQQYSHDLNYNTDESYNNNINNSDIEHYYHLESVPQSKNFSCEVCSKSFFSHGQFKKHIDEHVECPFPECKLKAHVKIIDQHISHQHMLVNFEALQIDDEAWISERKKRFPTAQRAELRRSEQLERIKRGERLGKEKKKLAQIRKEKSSVKEFKEGENKNNKREKKNFPSKGKKNNKPILPIVLLDSDDSDSETKWGVPPFRGTKEFYESTGEMSLFGVKTSQHSTEDLPDIDISDEEDWNKSICDGNQNSETKLHNALGSLICAYDSNSESDCEQEKLPVSLNKLETKSNPNTDKELELKNVATTSANNSSAEPKDIKNSSELKDVTNSNTEQVDNSNSSGGYGNRNKRARKHNKSNNQKKQKVDQNNKFKMNPSKRRRPTLLQKLLEPDIVHERNVILQCIRYIVQNNYFSK